MNYVEYGKGNTNTVMLLHGGGLSWWNYKKVAELIENDYRVILPILNGHAESDKEFSSIEDNARHIIDFIDKELGGKVFLIGGLSLGGQILIEILSQRKDICRYAIIESAPVIPQKLTHALIKPTFGSCYFLIKYKWFAKLQFKSLKITPDLFDYYYRDTVGISKKDMIAFLRANALYSLKESIKESTAKAYIFVGKKELPLIKRSAKIINSFIKDSTFEVLPGLYHGEFSINYAEKYAEKIKQMATGVLTKINN